MATSKSSTPQMQTLLGDLRKQNHGLLADKCFEEQTTVCF